MYFSNYLKQCRENSGLTQEQLVHALYSFDISHFRGLDTSTLSKWERSITKPSLARQVNILRYFQKLTGIAMPCWDSFSDKEAEEHMCEAGMKNMLGSKSKELIMRFPENLEESGNFIITQLRNTEKLHEILQINVDLDQALNHKFTGLDENDFKEWALYPTNAFFISIYKGHFFGLLFALRVKPEIFEKLMSFKLREKDLSNEHFATFDEPGCSYILSFFALNEKSATLLFIRYYAHLIANQRSIMEVGFATMMEDAKKLTRNMHYQFYKSITITEGKILESYRAQLPDFLASEYVIKILLSGKDNCPEE